MRKQARFWKTQRRVRIRTNSRHSGNGASASAGARCRPSVIPIPAHPSTRHLGFPLIDEASRVSTHKRTSIRMVLGNVCFTSQRRMCGKTARNVR